MAVAIVVSADGETTNEFTSLQAAFDAAQAGETVELLADLTIEAKVTASAFTGTFDLGGFTIDTTLVKADDIPLLGFENGCNVVITNGTIDIETTELDVADSTATLAANTTISSDGGYGVYVSGTGVFNIYGTITGSVDSMPCVWMGGTSTVNAYEGCVVDSVGDPFRINGSGRTLNIYGGTFRGGYPIVYVYNSNTSAINVYGGTFTSVNGLIGGNARETVVVTPLTDQCTAKFSRAAPDDSWSLGLDYYCAEGYGPKLVDGWYVIKAARTVTLKNGDAVVDTQVVADGLFATNVVLDVEGFKGWTNDTYTAAFDFATTAITADITLFAWIEAVGPTWPQDWPGDADEKVVEKFAIWSAANPGVDFTSEAVQNAFLMGVNADATIPTLKIESIAVEGDTATIVVSAEGVNLETGINGVLYVDGTNELGAEWATTEVEIGSAAEFTDGKATFTVPNAKFMKAGVGFKAPAVEPVTD